MNTHTLTISGAVGIVIAAGIISISSPHAVKGQPHSDNPIASLVPCGGCESDQYSAIAQITRSSSQQNPNQVPASAVLFDPHSYRTFFATYSANVVPSPMGSHWNQVPQQNATLKATFLPANSGSLVGPASGEFTFQWSPQQGGRVLLRDANWALIPQQDGSTHRIWAYAHLKSARSIQVGLQVLVIRGTTQTPVGASQTVSLTNAGDEVCHFDVPLPDSVLKQLKLDLGCSSSPYTIGIMLAPIGPPELVAKAELRVSGLQFGTMGTCCPNRGGKPLSGTVATSPGRGRGTPENSGSRAQAQQKDQDRPSVNVFPATCCDTDTLPSKVTIDRKTGELNFDVTLPAGVDDDFEPYAEIVDADAGDVTDVYPGIDPRTNDWMDRVACDHNIGGITQQNLDQILGFDFDLDIEGDGEPEDKDDPEVIKQLFSMEGKLAEEAEKLRESDEKKEYKVNMPSAPANVPWNLAEAGRLDPNEWAFYPGADIVYVHGLKTNHLKDMLAIPVLKAKEREPWARSGKYANLATRNQVVETEFNTTVSGNAPAKSLNPEYYAGGYFKNGAEWYWREGDDSQEQGHIPTFLSGSVPMFTGSASPSNPLSNFLSQKFNKGYANRYLIVSYSCAASAENGAQAILRQIADAMAFGEGVVNPRVAGYKSGFGSRGIVLVSHSTGGLVANIAMNMGKRRPSWKAGWVVDRVKLHVAAESAMSGSRLATLTLEALYGLEKYVANPPNFVKVVLKLVDKFLPGIPMAKNGSLFAAAKDSILFDLVPVVAQVRWGFYFNKNDLSYKSTFADNYVPPTVMVASAHPTQYSPLKYGYVNVGLDDGVANMNSASGNPLPAIRWPSGFVGGQVKNFDLGIYLGQPAIKLVNLPNLKIKVIGNGLDDKKRAVRYYLDHKDVMMAGQPVPTVDKVLLTVALPDGFFAAGPDYRITPTGMRTNVNYGGSLGLFNDYRRAVLDRYPNMFNGLSAAADHFDGTIGSLSNVSYSNYQDTKRLLSGTIEHNAEETFAVGSKDLGIYDSYTPPGLKYLTNDPYVGRPVLSKPLPTEVRFRGLRLYVKLFKKVRSFWLVKREYVLLDGWEERSKFDYVYWNYLGGGR